MRLQFFDVEHFQSMRFHDADRRQHGEVRKVFVINRVKLVELDQLQQVRKFQRENAVGLQQDLQSFDKVIQVWDLCQYVIAQNQVGTSAFGRELFCQFCPEEPH